LNKTSVLFWPEICSIFYFYLERFFDSTIRPRSVGKSLGRPLFFRADMKEKGYQAIRRRVLAEMLAASFLPFCLILAVGYYYFSHTLEAEVLSKLDKVVEHHKATIETFLEERRRDLRFVVDSSELDDLVGKSNLKKVLDRLKAAEAGFIDLGVIDSPGDHLAYVGPYQLLDKNYQNEAWFKEVMSKKEYISDVFLGFRGVPHFIIAVVKESRDYPWILRATVDTALFDQTVENVRIGRTGEAYIVNRDGLLQTRPRSSLDLLELDPDARTYLIPHEGIRTFKAKNTAGDEYLYATTWIKDGSWLLVVRQKREEAFSGLRTVTRLAVAISLVAVLAILVTALLATERTIKKMRRMESEKNQLSQQLVAAERLAVIGEMSAGFAHEINNPLQIIKQEKNMIEAAFEVIEESGGAPTQDDLAHIKDCLAQIGVQVERCGGITHGLLKFARKQPQEIGPVDLNRFIEEVISLAKGRAESKGITILEDLSPDLPEVKVDPTQLQQVILNLINNAFDAVMEKNGGPGGEIKVTTRLADAFVEIEVSDNGCGISPANLAKVFTPFFTTKPVGKGTGLGLAVCYGIIDKMGGVIEAASQEDRGATFTVRMPV